MDISAQQLDLEQPLSQYMIKNWSSQDGIPSNALNNVTATKDGFLWLSGYNGISRFDGQEFVTYSKSNVPLLNSNTIYGLFEDDDGNKWVCTNGSGILKFSDGKFTNPFEGQDVPKTISRGIADGDVIWLGSYNDGLYKLKDGKITQVDFPDVQDVTILDIKKDRNGAIWICTDGKGVTRIVDGIFTSYRAISGGASGRFRSIHIDQDGATWVGSYQGLYFLEDGKLSPIGILDGHPVNYITEDVYGNLWIAADNGIVRMHGITKEFEFLDKSIGIPGTEFTSIYIDDSNDLWFTSSRDGLFRMRSGNFKNYGVKQGLSSGKVNSMLEMENNVILVGTEDGGLFTIEDNKISEFEIKSNFPKTRIRNIYKDSKGVLWVSSYFGLFRKEGDKEKLYTTADGLPTNQIRGVIESADGHLLINTRNAGLIRWDQKDDFEIFNAESGVGSDFITAVNIHHKNVIVLGSNGGGLSLIDPSGLITNFGEEEGLPHSVIFSIYIDGENIWFASNSGLGLLKDSKIYTKNSTNGLPTESLFDITESDDGKFWVPSAFGIYTFDKLELLSFMMNESDVIEYDVYTEDHGMPTKECIGAVRSLKSADGKIWIPTVKGLTIIDPNNLVEQTKVPKVYLNRFLVNGTGVGVTEGVEIEAGKNRFTFEFTAPEYTNPASLQFKYRLESYDLDWNISSNKSRKVEYTNVPYGKYSFEVMASIDGKHWSKESATVTFSVLPYWYQTFWVISIFVLLILILIYIVHKWREGVREVDKLKLEQLITDRKRIVELQKEEIGAQRDNLKDSFLKLKEAQDKIEAQHTELSVINTKLEGKVARRTADLKMVVSQLISTNAELDQFVYRSAHDLRGPVSTLMGVCNLAKVDAGFINDPLFMETVEATATEMDALIKKLIELNSLKNGDLNVVNIDLKKLVAKIAQSQTIGNEHIKIKNNVDPFIYASDVKLISVLLRNVINNAVTYRDKDRDDQYIKIRIKLLPSKNKFEIVVEDNGIGINESTKDSLFDMFFKGVVGMEGLGLGLYEVSLIVKRLGGEVTIYHKDGVTIFRCILPISIESSFDNFLGNLIQSS